MTPARKPLAPPRVCGACLLHSRRDACCTLTGASKRKGDAACGEYTQDGRIEELAGKGKEG